jgi:hypothetical protein
VCGRIPNVRKLPGGARKSGACKQANSNNEISHGRLLRLQEHRFMVDVPCGACGRGTFLQGKYAAIEMDSRSPDKV